MPGDPLKPLSPGDPLPTSIQTWNPILEAARKREAPNVSASPPVHRLNGNEVIVKNISGITCREFELGFINNTATVGGTAGAEDTVIITDENNTGQFREQPVFRWTRLPGTWGGIWQGKWSTDGAVLQQPLKHNECGRAVIAGPTPIQLPLASGALEGSHELGYVYGYSTGVHYAKKCPFGFRLLSAADRNGLGWVNLSNQLWTCLGYAPTTGVSARSGENPGACQNGRFLYCNSELNIRRPSTSTSLYSAVFYRWLTAPTNYKWDVSGVSTQIYVGSERGDRVVVVQLLGDGRWWIVNWDPFDTGANGESPFPGNDTDPL